LRLRTSPALRGTHLARHRVEKALFLFTKRKRKRPCFYSQKEKGKGLVSIHKKKKEKALFLQRQRTGARNPERGGKKNILTALRAVLAFVHRHHPAGVASMMGGRRCTAPTNSMRGMWTDGREKKAGSRKMIQYPAQRVRQQFRVEIRDERIVLHTVNYCNSRGCDAAIIPSCRYDAAIKYLKERAKA
jgi:hypothetical protein